MAVTDEKTKQVFSANVQRVLKDRGLSINWLVVATGDYPNRIYPVVHGEAMPTGGVATRIAEALKVSLDSLFGLTIVKPASPQRRRRVSKILENSV